MAVAAVVVAEEAAEGQPASSKAGAVVDAVSVVGAVARNKVSKRRRSLERKLRRLPTLRLRGISYRLFGQRKSSLVNMHATAAA